MRAIVLLKAPASEEWHMRPPEQGPKEITTLIVRKFFHESQAVAKDVFTFIRQSYRIDE